MMNASKIRRLIGAVAMAAACVMIGSAITLPQESSAIAETQTIVLTSPFTAAIEQVHDSVVGINNYQIQRYGTYDSPFGNSFGFGFGFGYGYGNGGSQSQYEEREVLASTGSAVVVGKGFVLTNYHVVEDASNLKVTVTEEDGEVTEIPASLVAYDEAIDIAIVYAPKLDRQPVKLGDSDTLRVGDWAICIGNPLSSTFSGTVTTGIVSALNRAIESKGYDKYGRRETITNAMIQTDAAINSGNSGGGMFAVTGELMGIPTLKYTGSAYSGASIDGIGMCIPINAAKPLIEDVLSGKITATEPIDDGSDEEDANDLTGKPRLGVSIVDLSRLISNTNGVLPNGVYVREVEKDSPAELAGMEPGDIIVDVEDQVITTTTELQSIVGAHKAGDTLKIKVFRAPGLADYINGLARSSDVKVDEGTYIDLEVTLAIVDEVIKQ